MPRAKREKPGPKDTETETAQPVASSAESPSIEDLDLVITYIDDVIQATNRWNNHERYWGSGSQQMGASFLFETQEAFQNLLNTLEIHRLPDAAAELRAIRGGHFTRSTIS